MKRSQAERYRRRQAKVARRAHRIAAGKRPHRRVVDRDRAEDNLDWLMDPIRDQSKPREKAHRRARVAAAKVRQAWLPDRQPAPPMLKVVDGKRRTSQGRRRSV